MHNVLNISRNISYDANIKPRVSRFKDSAELETSRSSHIRLCPLRHESESRVSRLNSEETDSAESKFTRSTRHYDDDFVPHRNSIWK